MSRGQLAAAHGDDAKCRCPGPTHQSWSIDPGLLLACRLTPVSYIAPGCKAVEDASSGVK